MMKNMKLDELLKTSVDAEKNYQDSTFSSLNNVGLLDEYHIAFGVDGDYILYACITIQSLIDNSGNACLHFHIVTAVDTSVFEEAMQALVAGTCHQIHIHTIPEDILSHLPSTELFPTAIYNRFLIPYFIKNTKYVLYLDADIVGINNFTDIFKSIEQHDVTACVISEPENLAEGLAKNISLSGRRYFNAGVILINIEDWLANNVSEKAIAELEKKDKLLRFLDQDALNIVLEGSVHYIEQKYNTLVMLAHDDEGYQWTPEGSAVFLHFAGADKPWQKWNKQRVTEYFSDIYQRSFWAARSFDEPRNDQQAKKMYKLYLREKRFLQGAKWYLNYLKMRYGK